MTDNSNNNNNNNISMEEVQKMISAALQNALKNNSQEKKDDIHEEIVKERRINEEDRKRIEKEKEDAIFLSTIYSNIEKDKIFLPEDFKKVTDACIQAGETDEYKAQLIKKEQLERFFELQDNINLLSDSGRKKINDFFALTTEGKLHKAADVYPLISEVVNVKKNMYITEEKRKQKISIYESKQGFSKNETNRFKKSQDFLLGINKVFSLKD